MREPLNEKPHLQDRRDDWADASDEDWIDALLHPPTLICPFWLNYARQHRPHCLRRSLLLHESLGGWLGPPALKFLGRKP